MQSISKILIVDDKPENLIAMEAILCDSDVDIVTAQSGNEALAHMIKQEFALVLLDVQMPVMDGFETAKLMGGNAKTKNTPIIFLTALSKENKYIEKGYASGAVDYILKPVNPDILRQKVKIFTRLYEQNLLIKAQAVQIKDMYNIERQARVAKEELLIEQSKMATMGEMMGFMAHQWKQPINILSSCFQNINELASELMEDELIAESVEKGMMQLKYMSQTVDDFQHYLKPDRSHGEFNASRAIIDVLKLIGSYITKNGITLKYSCCLKDNKDVNQNLIMSNVICDCLDLGVVCSECCIKNATIHGSKNEFKQVLINLINNARDAIEMRNECEYYYASDEIKVTIDLIDENLVISIEDTAGGVPEEIKDKIFEPYFTTKDDLGTGIGLSMVKTIMETKFGGKLELENTEKGARFTLYIKIV